MEIRSYDSQFRGYDKMRIAFIRKPNHPESLSIGPEGDVYSVGKYGEVYRVDLANNIAKQYATAPHRCLGQAIDADGNMYAADLVARNVVKINPAGKCTTYATGPATGRFGCPNYPAFDAEGSMYLSDSSTDGTWSHIDGFIYRIKPGGGEAERWLARPINTPNAIALDAGDEHLYIVETYSPGISRVAIKSDGTAGDYQFILHMPRHVPDGIAVDAQGRLWISCHRPDAIYVYDLETRRLELFVDDWMGEFLRDPTDVAFGGPGRDILFAASLGNEVIHRMDNPGARGLRLNYPKLK